MSYSWRSSFSSSYDALMKAVILLSSSRLPYSLSLSGIGFGHMSRLKRSCSWQCRSRCSAVMMSALHGTSQDSPTLNMCALSVLCPVLSLNRITCSGQFSLWRLSDWLVFGCCCFHFCWERVLTREGWFQQLSGQPLGKIAKLAVLAVVIKRCLKQASPHTTQKSVWQRTRFAKNASVMLCFWEWGVFKWC